MPRPYDATTKRLLEIDPPAWLALAGAPVNGPVTVIDSDVSTVTAEADTIFQVGEPAEYLAHVEIQSSHELRLPDRLLHYNVLLNYRHELPVRSIAVLLRKEADSPGLVGEHRVLLPEGGSYLDFRYDVVKVWTLDVEAILNGRVGILPLAPISRVREGDLPGVIGRMMERLEREVPKEEANLLWTATDILMGLRYTAEFSAELLKGVRGMRESSTFQAILAEGEAKGEAKGRRSSLLRIGKKRFGPADAQTETIINAIDDADRLEALIDRALEVSDWQELLAT